MKKVVIVHLWEGNPSYCWYSAAKEELEKLGFTVSIPQMPEPDKPKKERWVSALQSVIGKPNEGTNLVGHSIGAVTILKYLESLGEGEKVGCVVLVAGFTDDMGYNVFSSFFTKPLDFKSIRSKVSHFVVIASNYDPYVDMKYAIELSKKLGAELIIKKGLKHMSKGCDKLPDVALAIERYAI